MTARPLNLALSLALALLPAPAPRAFAQAAPGRKAAEPSAGEQKPAPPTRTPAFVCDQPRAVALVEQQAAEARSFEASAGQITVMLRAADLLWPYKQEAARAVFAEAFDLAVAHFRRRGDETETVGRGITVRIPDQRFEALRAISKRDAAWARRLAERTAEESKRAAAAEPRAGANAGRDMGEKLIGLARSMLGVDVQTAVGLARGSFRQPASMNHAEFFYELAKRDQKLADELFLEAVAAYAAAGTTHDLSYLSVYPFALKHTISAVRNSTSYDPPPDFRQNPAVQEAFVKALLARAEAIIKAPDQFADKGNPYYWETTQIVSALASLDALAAERLPASAQRVADALARAEAVAGDTARENSQGFLDEQKRADEPFDFDAAFEKAEGTADPDRRDQAIAFLAMRTTRLEHLARLETLAEKVSDANARRQLLDWINFTRAQRLAREGRLDDAKTAAGRVGELDLRAVLHLEIAREAIKRLEDRARARELLDDVASAAAKAPDTDMKARARLGVAHLFASFDGLRALEVMGEAVKTINSLDNPDLSHGFIMRRIEGKTFGTYGSLVVPGFSLENAFRELGPYDFEGALLAARDVSDRALRATAVVGLAAHCLEQSAKKPAPDKPAAKERPAKSTKP